MKTYLILIALSLFLFSCSDNSDDNPKKDCPPIVKGAGDFYRITAHSNVDVIPEERRVRILVRVADSMDVGVTGLNIDDFIILENCVDKVDDKESDANINDRVISTKMQTVLVLDISASLEGMVEQIKAAAIELVNSKVDNQEFAIYTFDSKVKLIQDFTANIETLVYAINQVPETGLDNSTNLYQAISDAANHCENKISLDQIVSGSIIVFTDGKHNADPNLTVNDAKKAVSGINVYVAALKSDNLEEAPLMEIAGKDDNYLYVENIDKLKASFLDIQSKVENESLSTYFLNYVSPIAVPGTQYLRVMIKENSNTGSDAYIEKSFETEGF